MTKSIALIDQHLKTVGTLVVNASLCDMILFNAFKIISNCENGVASAIYFSSETIHSKKNFIKRILKVNDDPEETKIVERIVAATEKSNTQRNELSHALLQISGDQVSRLNARHQEDGVKPVTAPYLDSLWKLSSRALLDSQKAYQELCSKRGIPPIINHE